MQIRYLEAMQSMAKTANSKVIFLPAHNQTVGPPLTIPENPGEGHSKYAAVSPFLDMTENNDGFQRAVNARVVENI
jgi:hypothetical protein